MVIQLRYPQKGLTTEPVAEPLPFDETSPRTLLIIDDEKDVCLLLRKALLNRFDQIEFAHSLREGEAVASRIVPDVILLDNNLPDGHGVEHINTFRIVDKSVQIVVVSAMDIRYEAMAAGADEFLRKPVDIGALRVIIDRSKN